MTIPKAHFYKQKHALEYIDNKGGYLFKAVFKQQDKERHVFCVINRVEALPQWIEKSHTGKYEIVETISGINISPTSGCKSYFDIDCFRVETKNKLMCFPEAEPHQLMKAVETLFDHCISALNNDMSESESIFFWSFGETKEKYSFHLTVENDKFLWAYPANKKDPHLSLKSFVEHMEMTILSDDRFEILRQHEEGEIRSIVDPAPYNNARSLLRIPTCYSATGRILKPVQLGDERLDYVVNYNIFDYLNNISIEDRTHYEIKPEFILDNLTKNMDSSEFIPSEYMFLDKDDVHPETKTTVTVDDHTWLTDKLEKNLHKIIRFISFRLHGVEFRDITQAANGFPVVRLKNKGPRHCLISSEINHSDNAYLVINKFCEVRYGCNNHGCKRRTLFVGKLENCHFMPYRYYNDMAKIPRRKIIDNLPPSYRLADITDYCKSVYTHIAKPQNDYILVRHQEIYKDDVNSTLRDVYVKIPTDKFRDSRRWDELSQKETNGTVKTIKTVHVLKKVINTLIGYR